MRNQEIRVWRDETSAEHGWIVSLDEFTDGEPCNTMTLHVADDLVGAHEFAARECDSRGLSGYLVEGVTAA
jgi:hypothetical protein